MRTVYFDTEFLPENPLVSGFISIGLVDSEGSEYYAINAWLDEEAIRYHPWMGLHVWNWLPKNAAGGLDLDHPDVKEPWQIRKELTEFFGRKQSEAAAYYQVGDMYRLHSLWNNNWAQMPEDIPRWCHELKSRAVRLGCPQLPEQTYGEHHALEDARHNKLVDEFLTDFENQLKGTRA